MTTYYVGPGGNDSNDGLTWANRFLTLNGAEDEPVAANDTVYVGPGTYRELLTCDVSGSSGQPITYIGDVTGEHTDGVGGIVRITGSDDDQTSSRSYCIYASNKQYRTFRGFVVDLSTAYYHIYAGTTSNGWVIEDCVIGIGFDEIDGGIYFQCAESDLFIARRNIITVTGRGIYTYATSDITVNSSSIIENCLFYGQSDTQTNRNPVTDFNVDNFTVKNCTFVSAGRGISTSSVDTGVGITVENCIFESCYYALYATASGEITEDYNALPLNNAVPLTNVTPGSNSNAYPALFNPSLLLDQYKFSPTMFDLANYSPLRAIAGSSESSDDLFGMDRPATSAKKSWGAGQYVPIVRETSTTYGSSTASLELSDAGRVQFKVPVTATSTTIAVYAYHEANYAGTLPQMVIKQPGQSDRTTTDTGSASTWNELTDTFTPDSSTDFVMVELVSNNTATSGSYAVYFDAISVS